MATHTINIAKEQPKLADLLTLAREGQEILLTEGETPLARIVPVPIRSGAPRIGGLHEGAVWVSE